MCQMEKCRFVREHEDSSQSWNPVVRTGGEEEVVGGQGKGMEPRREAEEE